MLHKKILLIFHKLSTRRSLQRIIASSILCAMVSMNSFANINELPYPPADGSSGNADGDQTQDWSNDKDGLMETKNSLESPADTVDTSDPTTNDITYVTPTPVYSYLSAGWYYQPNSPTPVYVDGSSYMDVSQYNPAYGYSPVAQNGHYFDNLSYQYTYYDSSYTGSWDSSRFTFAPYYNGGQAPQTGYYQNNSTGAVEFFNGSTDYGTNFDTSGRTYVGSTPPIAPNDPPVTPNPTDPTQPADPADPGQPIDPTDPGQPTDPVDPNQPTDPTSNVYEPDYTCPTGTTLTSDNQCAVSVDPIYVCPDGSMSSSCATNLGQPTWECPPMSTSESYAGCGEVVSLAEEQKKVITSVPATIITPIKVREDDTSEDNTEYVSCPDGSTFNSYNGSCETFEVTYSCPSGLTEVRGTCVRLTEYVAKCSGDGVVYDAQTGSCMGHEPPSVKRCPMGSDDDGNGGCSVKINATPSCDSFPGTSYDIASNSCR